MRHRRRLLARGVALVAALALVLIAAVAAFGVHDENFQLEGNATAADLHYVDIDDINPGNPVDTVLTPGDLVAPFDGAFDWDSLFDDSGPDGTGNEMALPAGFTGSDFIVDFKYSGTTFITSDDTTFATGSKDTLDITPGWQCNQDNNVNSKTDIVNGYAALYESGTDNILYFGLEKDVDNGTNNVGLWLFQDPNVGCVSPGGSVAFTGNHVAGDLFIVSAFTNGGGVANVTAYAWTDDLDGDGTADDPGLNPTPVDNLVNGDCLDAATNDRLCAVVNGETITMPWKSADSSVIDAPKVSPNFFEGGINLSDFPEFADSCFTGFMLETRSSQSLTATLFDYVLGDIDTCNPELSIDKEPETQTHNVGDSFDYTLTVENTGDADAEGASVSDTIPDGLTINSVDVDPDAAGDCDVTGQDIDCTLDVPIGGSVTITVNVTATEDVFGESDEGCVDVDNTGTVSMSGDTDPSDDSDTVVATICRPLVEKTADGSFDRDWTWTIDKVGDQTELTLSPDQQFLVNYDVTVSATSADKNFEVAGTISVENPSPSESMTVDITDAIDTPAASLAATAIACNTDGIAGADEDGDDVVIDPGQTITCTYSFTSLAGVAAGDDGTNTATATLNGIGFDATDGYSFDLDVETDECIDVTDTYAGDLGTVCAGDAPKTFEYSRMIGPFDSPEECGDNTVDNTAAFETNDTATTGDDDWQVIVHVPCDTGCTLTQGYWKTHSEFGPAPTDPNWDLLPDVDGDGVLEGANETFFLSGMTWYEVFWTNPGGNAYYVLAHQYEAAVLNILSGADSPAAVDAAISEAETLFETYTPAQIAALKGKQPPRPTFISLAGTLGSYNEGLTGPGHCDEDSLSSQTL